jgi:hypothetical protein
LRHPPRHFSARHRQLSAQKDPDFSSPKPLPTSPNLPHIAPTESLQALPPLGLARVDKNLFTIITIKSSSFFGCQNPSKPRGVLDFIGLREMQ